MKFNYLALPCLSKICDTVVLIYRQWTIMAHSEKLKDAKAFGNVKLLTQKDNIIIQNNHFLPEGHSLSKLGRDLLGDATYLITRL